ncbi:MAG: hypothetical protein WDO71_26150 [Bacteroidota bacterium]
MYRNLSVFAVSALIVLAGCERKPFVEDKLKFEKVSDGCSITPQAFKMTSNFGGERYEFDRCLSADFAKEQMSVSRHGDTVVVNFAKPGTSKAIFNLTLDIDSYPKYNFLTIDGDTYAIVASN